MKFPLVALLTLFLQGPAPSQQPAQPVIATASIEGIIVRSGTTEAISGADVELTRVEGTTAAPLTPQATQYVSTMLQGGGPGGPLPPPVIAAEVKYARTGPDGKFSFKDLKAGKYRLVSVRVGGAFYPSEYGQHDPRQRGLHFPIREGEAAKDLRIEMVQTGAIAGRVLDEDGEPMGHILMMALEEEYRNGERLLNMIQSVATDEHGNYRLYWLAPGSYYVAAVYEDQQRRTINPDPIPPGRRGPTDRATSPVVLRSYTVDGDLLEETYAVVYNGSVIDPSRARTVDVQAGLTTGGIDISMGPGRARVQHIRGVVINGATGQPSSASVIAIPKRTNPNTVVLTGSADQNGVFDLVGAMPGTSYSLQADALITRRVRGRITGVPPVNANRQPVNPQVGMLPITSSFVTNIANAPVDASGAFDIQRVVPGRYVLYALARGSVGNVTGRAFVDVNTEDVNGVIVNLAPTIELSGRIVVERQTPATGPDPAIPVLGVVLRTDPVIAGIPTGTSTPTPDGTFKYPAANAPPLQTGNYRVIVNPILRPAVSPGETPPNLPTSLRNAYVKAIRLGNDDVLNGGLRVTGSTQDELVITIGTNPGSLEGRVVNGTGQAVRAATVVLIPESGLKFRVDHKFAFTDARGAFQIQGVPPGDYQVYAFEQIEKGDWQDPRAMRAFEGRGKAVHINEGGRDSLEVVSIPAP